MVDCGALQSRRASSDLFSFFLYTLYNVIGDSHFIVKTLVFYMMCKSCTKTDSNGKIKGNAGKGYLHVFYSMLFKKTFD